MHDGQALRRAGWTFLVGFGIHNFDHVRRGTDGISEQVIWGGTGVAVLSAVVLTLVFTNHRLAANAAAAAGIAIAFGVSATHLLPEWGSLSDPLPGGAVDGFTWFAVLAEVVGAVVLGLVGLRQSARAGFSTTPPASA
jgi:hypothetical protein